MKVPSFRPPNKGDFPGVEEETLEAIKVLSDQLDLVTEALQSNISLEDNGNTEIKALSLRSGEEELVNLSVVKGRPIEVTIVDQDKFDSTKLAWQVVDQGQIKIKVTWDDTANHNVPINTRILVRGQTE